MLGLEEAIDAIGKAIGKAAFHDAMSGGHGVGHLSEAEVLRIVYGRKISGLSLRQTAGEERDRLFKEQRKQLRDSSGLRVD